jgi:hypothetical protein
LLKKLPYNLGTAAVSSTPRRPPAQHARVYFPTRRGARATSVLVRM